MTAQEYHAKYAFPPQARCICGAHPAIRAIVMCPLDEVRKKDPLFDQVVAIATINPQAAKQFYETLVQLRGSDGKPENYVRMSTTYSCLHCKKDFYKALAKAPSWAVVEINEGPKPDMVIST